MVQVIVDVVSDKIPISKATFHTSRKVAIDSLAEALAEELQTTLSLEALPQLSGDFIERTSVMDECRRALHTKQTILLIGSGGLGKTTLGSRLAQEWGSRQVCWFTIRLGLNDHLINLLMQLGYFFRQQGVPALWQEIIASQGKTHLPIVLGLVPRTFNF